MRIVGLHGAAGPEYGIWESAGIRRAGNDLTSLVPSGPLLDLADVTLTSPVHRPGNIIAVGLNYRDHALETGNPIPKFPILFAKFTNCVSGPYDPILVPSSTGFVDYEAELGVVIGRTARGVSHAEALNYVLGYTCLNDVSARDLQMADGQWSRAKSFDTFCPMGPSIVTRDEIRDPQLLAITTKVNGETLQRSNTEQMIFSVADLIEYISRDITLQPGDVLATGTPPGVGQARRPPRGLVDGDVVEVEIESVGVIRNEVRVAATTSEKVAES